MNSEPKYDVFFASDRFESFEYGAEKLLKRSGKKVFYYPFSMGRRGVERAYSIVEQSDLLVFNFGFRKEEAYLEFVNRAKQGVIPVVTYYDSRLNRLREFDEGKYLGRNVINIRNESEGLKQLEESLGEIDSRYEALVGAEFTTGRLAEIFRMSQQNCIRRLDSSGINVERIGTSGSRRVSFKQITNLVNFFQKQSPESDYSFVQRNLRRRLVDYSDDEDPLYTSGQVAKFFFISPNTVRKYFGTVLEGRRVPGSKDIRIPRSSLVSYMRSKSDEVWGPVLENMGLTHKDVYVE